MRRILSMDYLTLLKDLTHERYAPVYFLQGDEPFYINALVDFMEHRIVPAQARSFDLTTLYGAETNVQQVIVRAKRFPMMASHQVILVKEAQGLQDLQREGGQKRLLSYVAQPNEQTILVFAYKGKTLDQRKTFTKKLAGQTVFFTAKKVYERDLPRWIERQVTDQGFHITPEAAHMLATLVGDNLQILSNELTKMMANLSEGEEITLAMVRTHVSPSKGFAMFDLQQAVQAHEIDRAWEVAAHFVENPKKYPLLPQITLLTHFFSKLLLLHTMPHAGRSEVASKLGIPPYFVRNYQEALGHYDVRKTVENLHLLHEADLQLKGIDCPALPDTVVFKTLVAKLLNPSQRQGT